VIKVVNTMEVYEIDGKKPECFPRPQVTVESHWNDPNMVVLIFPDGARFTVVARDIAAAISNATNSRRH